MDLKWRGIQSRVGGPGLQLWGQVLGHCQGEKLNSMFTYVVLTLLSLVSVPTSYMVGCGEQGNQRAVELNGAFSWCKHRSRLGVPDCTSREVSAGICPSAGPEKESRYQRVGAKHSNTATQQRYPSSQWGHYTSRCRGTSDQCRDLINEEWAHPGVYPCPPRMPFRSVTAVHIYITRRHKYGNSVFSSCYNFWAEVGSSYPD